MSGDLIQVLDGSVWVAAKVMQENHETIVVTPTERPIFEDGFKFKALWKKECRITWKLPTPTARSIQIGDLIAVHMPRREDAFAAKVTCVGTKTFFATGMNGGSYVLEIANEGNTWDDAASYMLGDPLPIREPVVYDGLVTLIPKKMLFGHCRCVTCADDAERAPSPAPRREAPLPTFHYQPRIHTTPGPAISCFVKPWNGRGAD